MVAKEKGGITYQLQYFKETIGQYDPMFADFDQHDSCKAFSGILGIMSADMYKWPYDIKKNDRVVQRSRPDIIAIPSK